MILDHLSRSDLYRGLHPLLAAAFDFLQRPEARTLPLGRHSLDGERLFAIVDEYVTRPPDQCRFEAHRRYWDVQHLQRGAERIGIAPLEMLTLVTPHDDERDVAFFAGEGGEITLRAGEFAVFAPHDAHRPCIAVGQPAPVRKIVIKAAITGDRPAPL